MSFSRQELVDVLLRAECELTFIKLDGTKRLMRCTLNEKVAGSRHFENIKNKDNPKAPNPETVTCIDLEKDAWRSYRLDSIESFRIV